MKRKGPFVTGEYYHIYNRGTDKRSIFLEDLNVFRFLFSMHVMNQEKNTNGINKLIDKDFEIKKSEKLVSIVCFNLIQNHFHFILRQEKEGGIIKFMHKLGTGYTNYFNIKNRRSGALFQGKFKSKHISNNYQLLHTSVYVNLNHKKHNCETLATSWEEFISGEFSNQWFACDKDIILDQFESKEEYKKYAVGVRLQKT